MFLNLAVLVNFWRKSEHFFVSSLLHICLHKDGVSTSRLYCVWECRRWRFI